MTLQEIIQQDLARLTDEQKVALLFKLDELMGITTPILSCEETTLQPA